MSPLRVSACRVRRIALALVLAALAASVFAPSAGAHATLLRSEPADAASLANPPRTIRLWFSEELAPSVSRIQLRDAKGNPVAGTTLDLSAADAGQMALSLPRLPRGVYSVDWRVLSEDDVHVSEGTFAFGVGAHVVPAAESEADGSVVGVVDVVFRWVWLFFLAGTLGGLALVMLVFDPLASRRTSVSAEADRAGTRTLRLAAVCACGCVAVGPGILLSQASSLATSDTSEGNIVWQLLTASRWGSLWIAREVLVIALVGTFALLLRDRSGHPGRRSPALWACVSVALAIVAVQALSGHAYALTPHRVFAVVVAGLHLLAALVWIGGLFALLLSLGPLLSGNRSESKALARAYLARFSPLAAASVALLAVTGLYYAGQQVASVDALLTTLYGRVLLGKLGLIVAVGAIGFLNTLILSPRLAAPIGRLLRRPAGWTPLPAPPPRSLLVSEAALGVALLLMVGLLTATPPARGPAFRQVPTATPSFRSSSAEDLLVSISVKPNRPGLNLFQVRAVSTRRPAPGAIERIRLRFTNPEGTVTSPPLTEIEAGRYQLSGSYLDESGSRRIETLIDRRGIGESSVSFDWAVAPSGTARPALVSSRPLEPILTRAAALLLFCLVIACAALLVAHLWRGGRMPVEPLILRGAREGEK